MLTHFDILLNRGYEVPALQIQTLSASSRTKDIPTPSVYLIVKIYTGPLNWCSFASFNIIMCLSRKANLTYSEMLSVRDDEMY